MKQYELNDDRIVVVEKSQGTRTVILKQKDSDIKSVEFTASRWAQFRQCMDEIETNVKTLIAGKTVAYRHPIGGGYYVSVSTGIYCIDIRKFYVPYGQEDVKPTRRGLALRLHEWPQMKKIVDSINAAHPSLGTALPCYMNDDHQNQLGALQCRECNPFTQDIFG